MRMITALFGFVMAASMPLQTASSAELSVLARPQPWPAADHLIAYRGRLWFSTAVRGINHNSADIWSFDPDTRKPRFERFLFSQYAGIPAVHRGLLFWPHEDMREGLGQGVISVTNGQDWRHLRFSAGERMLHTHAVTRWRGKLVASLAGWNSALVVSSDGGATWETLVNDPPPMGTFHRYNDVASAGGRLFVRHWTRSGSTLAEFKDGEVFAVKGWPEGRMSRLTVFNDAIYAIVRVASGAKELWRATSGEAEQVGTDPTGLDIRALASDGELLWLVARTGTGGQLWSTSGNFRLKEGPTFAGGIPVDATAAGPGQIYVGGEGDDGFAILWGPNSPETGHGELLFAPLPEPALCPLQADDQEPSPDEVKSRMIEALTDHDNYKGHGRGLRELILKIVAEGPPRGFFSTFLDAKLPKHSVDVFGGQFSVPAGEIATWLLTQAMGMNCERIAPLRFLAMPWHRQPNGPQKWFDPLLAAMHVIQQNRQDDFATIDALVSRLERPGDPIWLQSQVTGTLAALTGQKFAYDTGAWRAWWASARASWPDDTSGG